MLVLRKRPLALQPFGGVGLTHVALLHQGPEHSVVEVVDVAVGLAPAEIVPDVLKRRVCKREVASGLRQRRRGYGVGGEQARARMRVAKSTAWIAGYRSAGVWRCCDSGCG